MSLPVLQLAAAIGDALRSGNRLVISAPTGSGKSTQVPQILLREGLAERGRIVVLQPRRLATRMVATRVAHELGVPLGGLVGFQTRQEQAISAQTRIAFMTEGLFVRQMLGQPDIAGVSCVVLDEFHERSVDADLVLGSVRRLQEGPGAGASQAETPGQRPARRPDLRLVVMSATLDIERLRDALACPVLTSHGRLHPVEIRHVRTLISERVWDAAADAAVELLRGAGLEGGGAGERNGRAGDVLVFMPGVYEINRTLTALRARLGGAAVDLHPLHGSLTPAQQDKAVTPGPRRRVIVSTNVAETSLTIEGVSAVVDSGLARTLRHDVRRGLNVLDVGPISRASAEQRAGRAGRLGPGCCVRLWTAADHAQRPERDLPEVRRIELSETLLHLHAMGVPDPGDFPWLDPPEEAMLERVERLLLRLGAIEANSAARDETGTAEARCAVRLSRLGQRMSAFPVHPRLARFLVEAAARRCLGRAVVWAALAGDRDILERPEPGRLLSRVRAGEAASDLGVRESLLMEAIRRDFAPDFLEREGLSGGACREAARTIEQLRAAARRERMDLAEGTSEDPDSVSQLVRSLLPAFPDHLAVRLDAQRPHCAMPGRRRVVLAATSVVRQPGALLVLEVQEIGKGDRAETAVSLAVRVEDAWLAEAFPQEHAVLVEDCWNAERSAMEQVERRVLRLAEGELELGRTVRTGAAAGDVEGAAAAIVERIMRGELMLERWDDRVEQWIRRVRLVAARVPERGLIAYDDDDRRVILHEIVGDASRFSAVRDKPCLEAVMNALSWEDQSFVRDMAPESIRLPSGFAMRIDYPVDGPPVGRAKIQQLYGLSQTPTICRGRQPILLEILAPSQRPVQRTQDLANFWATLYPELRKELKRRYPRHEWR